MKKQREKVVTPYFIGGGFAVTRYNVAVAANEGEEALRNYIEGLRAMWKDIQTNPGADRVAAANELNELAKAGKYASAIYAKHFAA